MAVHRESRRHVARLLRRAAAGHIGGEQFEDELMKVDTSGDRGLDAVVSAACFLYDDYFELTPEDEAKLSREGRREVARWVLFLLSGEEYRWPNWSPLKAVGFTILLPLHLLTWGRLWDFIERKEAEHHGGHRELWPFHSPAQLAAAASRDPFR